MLSRANRFRVRGPVVLSILVIAVLTAACAPSAGAPAGAGNGPAAAPAGGGGGNPAGAPAGGQDGGGAGNPPNNQAPDNGNENPGSEQEPAQYVAGQEGLQIIKTGTMQLQVAGIDAAVSAASQQIAALGGYVSGSDRSGDGESAQASVTFRVPAASWEDATARMRDLGEKVLSERSSSDDVTTQIVDLAARIKNLETTEAAYQTFMDRAADIEDILTLQDRLTSVRGQIEQLVAEKASLESRAAFSTLTVVFSLKPTPVVVSVEPEGFDAAVEAHAATASLVNLLEGLATAGIWFGIVWLPILAFFTAVGAVAFMVGRRLRGAGPGDGAPVEPSAAAGA